MMSLLLSARARDESLNLENDGVFLRLLSRPIVAVAAGGRFTVVDGVTNATTFAAGAGKGKAEHVDRRANAMA